MKVRDLLTELLRHDLDDEVRVQLEVDNTLEPAEIDKVKRINADQDPHVGIVVAVNSTEARALRDVLGVLEQHGMIK